MVVLLPLPLMMGFKCLSVLPVVGMAVIVPLTAMQGRLRHKDWAYCWYGGKRHACFQFFTWSLFTLALFVPPVMNGARGSAIGCAAIGLLSQLLCVCSQMVYYTASDASSTKMKVSSPSAEMSS